MKIKVMIQVDGGSSERRFYEERTLEYKETRAGYPPFPYPYGFILGTKAADGDCVDCYVITREHLQVGSIVECEPRALLEQIEDGEIDHKVLAALPGREVELTSDVLGELRNFIHLIFKRFPDVRIEIGNILSREEAIHHIEQMSETQNGTTEK